MSSIYLPVVAVESLAENCSDTAPSDTWSASPTDAEHSSNESKTAFSTTHPSIVGLSESLLTAGTRRNIRAWLTASVLVSPAHRSVSPENNSENQTQEMLGRKPETRSESLNHDLHSLKMCQDLCGTNILSKSCKTYATWGVMLDGQLSARTPLDFRITAPGCGWLPTPNGDDANNTTRKSGQFMSLARWWNQRTQSRPLIGFWEWVMGWPIGWSDLEQLPTAKFRQWQQRHSEFLPRD